MKINLAENLLRFGAKNLSEESKKKLSEQPAQNLGTVNVVAKNPMGANFASANKGKSFGAIPWYDKPAYLRAPGADGTDVNGVVVDLLIKDIIYSSAPDAKYNPATKQTTAGAGNVLFILNAPGYVDDLRINVSSNGSVSVPTMPKLAKVFNNLYDAQGTKLLNPPNDPTNVNELANYIVKGVNQTPALNAIKLNQMVAGASSVLASTKDTKPGVGTKG